MVDEGVSRREVALVLLACVLSVPVAGLFAWYVVWEHHTYATDFPQPCNVSVNVSYFPNPNSSESLADFNITTLCQRMNASLNGSLVFCYDFGGRTQ